MKESKFNLFYKDENVENFVLFNSKSTALVIMTPGEIKIYKNLLKKSFYAETSDEITLVNELKKGDFLVDDNTDEFEILRFLQKCSQFSTNSLGLTIAPTLNCNFGCNYCYEGKHNINSKMSDEVQEQIINLVKNHIHTISSLDVTWYGGEPLLSMDVIENLSSNFLSICTENKVSYNASIITNGYCLTKDIAKKFNDLHIAFAQITLDGNKFYHDSKRPLKNGSGTFDRIISNLVDIKDIFSNIAIRVNTDNLNKEHVSDVIHILKEKDLLNITAPYLGYIEPTNDFYSIQNCLSQDQFAEVNNNFFSELSKNITIDSLTNYPTPKLNSCIADSINGYVIDPKGKLFRCWCDIGFDEYSIGSLKEGITNYSRVTEYFNYDIFSDDTCKNCNIAPLCLGGCPRRRIDNKDDHCSPIKYSLKENIFSVVHGKNPDINNLYPFDIYY